MSKSKTSVTPNAPTWLSNNLKATSDFANSYIGTDPTSYVAPVNQYQQTAADNSLGLGVDNTYTNEANRIAQLVGNYKSPQAQAASLLTNLQSYISPYINQVVDTSLAGYDKNAGALKAQSQAQQAAAGGYGASSRGSIYDAELGGNLALNRGQLASGLYNQAFTTGAGLANQDAERATQVSLANAQLNLAKQNQGLDIAQLLGNLGLAQQESGRSNIATQLGAGNSLYNVQNATAASPLTLLQAVAGAQGSIPTGALVGQTQKTSGSPLSALGTLALGLGTLGTGGLGAGLGGLFGGGSSSVPGWLAFGS